MNAPQEQPKRPDAKPSPAWFRQTPPPAPDARTPRPDDTPPQDEPGYGHGV